MMDRDEPTNASTHDSPGAPGFVPNRWLTNPHLQTLAGKFLRPSPRLHTRRERIDTPDGDFLDLDFVGPDRSAPIILVLHGLEGSSRRRYMLNAYSALIAQGLRPVGMNFRGCSGEPNRKARAYHSGDTQDIRQVVRLLAQQSTGPVGLIGYSLGANAMLKYLAEEGAGATNCVFAAAAISVPFDLAAGSERLASGIVGRIYTTYFLRNLKRKIRSKELLLRSEFDLDAIYRARNLREFDDVATAPMHGFTGAADYYARSSSSAFIAAIRTPTLVVHAMDDPFLPADRVPMNALDANPVISPVLSAHGGHVGFVSGSLRRPRFWAEELVSGWLRERAPAPTPI